MYLIEKLLYNIVIVVQCFLIKVTVINIFSC
jgi:hypothetical protein